MTLLRPFIVVVLSIALAAAWSNIILTVGQQTQTRMSLNANDLTDLKQLAENEASRTSLSEPQSPPTEQALATHSDDSGSQDKIGAGQQSPDSVSPSDTPENRAAKIVRPEQREDKGKEMIPIVDYGEKESTVGEQSLPALAAKEVSNSGDQTSSNSPIAESFKAADPFRPPSSSWTDDNIAEGPSDWAKDLLPILPDSVSTLSPLDVGTIEDFEFGHGNGDGQRMAAFVGRGPGSAPSSAGTGMRGTRWTIDLPDDTPWRHLEDSPWCMLVAVRVQRDSAIQVATFRNGRLQPEIRLTEFLSQNRGFSGRHVIEIQQRSVSAYAEALLSRGGGWNLRLLIDDQIYLDWTTRIRTHPNAIGYNLQEIQQIVAHLSFDTSTYKPSLKHIEVLTSSRNDRASVPSSGR